MTTQLLKRNDLEWTKAPFGELTRLAWPIAVSTLSYSVMTLVDTLFVGRLGADALAGAGLGGTMAFGLVVFSIGLLRGVKVLVSQASGAGHHKQTRAYLGAGLVLAGALGAITAALGQVVAPMLGQLTSSIAAGNYAQSYMSIRLLGTPLLLVYVALRESRYGVGDSRTPMVASLAANGLNIVLDYLFIVQLGYGVAGAAWATVAAHAAECGVLVWAQRVEGFGLRMWRGRHLASVVRIGLPTGLQFSLEVGAFVLLAAMISALGTTEMAAHQIAIQVIHISFLPAYALAEAASIMTGQAVGADRDDLVLPVARMAMLVAAVYTGLCAVVFAARDGRRARSGCDLHRDGVGHDAPAHVAARVQARSWRTWRLDRTVRGNLRGGCVVVVETALGYVATGRRAVPPTSGKRCTEFTVTKSR